MTDVRLVGTSAENCIVAVTTPLARLTVAVVLVSVKPVLPDVLPLKILIASTSPPGTGAVRCHRTCGNECSRLLHDGADARSIKGGLQLGSDL